MKRRFILIHFFVVFALSLTMFIVNMSFKQATAKGDDGFSPVNMEDVYEKGDLIGVPEVTFTKDGNTYSTDCVMLYPDGSAKQVNGNIVLTQFGKYCFEYHANVSGKIYSTKKEFYAYLPKYELSSPDDNVYYEENGVDGSRGEMVTLSSEQTLTINDYFDITKSTISKPIFESVIVPSSVGTSDFDTLQIDFICKNDQSQYLRIVVNYNESNNCTYTLAGVQNQTPSGYESYWKKLHVGNSWGAPCHGTFSGITASGQNQLFSDVKIWLDYASKKVYANVAKGFVIDLDDSQYFGNLWTGFTENEVFLRISASRYKGTAPAKFLILRAGDIDLTEQNVFDNVAPEITIDYEGLDREDLPVGIVGNKYKAFGATANDYLSGACNVTMRVFARVNTTSEHEVRVIDGYFTPTSAGEHVISYFSVDNSGNVATETVSVNVVGEYSAPDMIFSEKVTSALTGEAVRIAAIEPLNCIGNATIESKVTFNGEDVEIVNGCFRPAKSGDYTVGVTVTDYLGRKVEDNYVVSVSENDEAVFIDEIYLPDYLIAGSTYSFDKVFAYDYTASGDGKKVEATLVTEDKNGTKEHADGKYTPDVNAHLDVAKIYYKATINGKAATSEKFDIPVCVVGDGKNIDISKYFISDSATVEKTGAGMRITTSTDKARVDFANFLLANGASIEFDVDAAENNFSKINVYLTDVIDASRSIKITYEKSSETRSYFYVNGGVKYEIPASFSGQGQNSFTYKYDNDRMIVSDGSSVTFNVAENLNGSAFTGFTSGKVKFTLEFEGVKGNSTIILAKLNGQNTTSVKADLIKPRISLDDLMAFRYQLNDVVELSTAVAMDVLDPNIENYYTVTGVGGEIIKDVNGVELSRVALNEKHTVKLDKYGTYRVSFTAIDWNDKKEVDFGYIMEVVDISPPVLAILDETAKTAKVGDKMNVAKAVSIDELDGELEITVFVLLPDGTFAKHGTSVTEYTMKGRYVFYFYTSDSTGNTAIKTYEVMVE